MKKINKHLKLIFSKSIIHFSVITVFVFALLTGCKKDSATEQSRQDAQAQTNDQLVAKYGMPDIVVHAGSSIQVAVQKAKKGAVIFIEPGIYKEAIVISKPGIKLVGKFSLNGDAVVIKNPGDEEDGISVTDEGDGFVLVNVTVKDFEENGVYLDSVDNYIISGVKASNNGEYGIFPVHSNHGVVEFCVVTGSSDTGIYVGQSWDVKMQFNIAYGNVNGLEVENSTDVDVAFNQSFNNVLGVLVDLLPGKDIKTSSNVHVRLNNLYNNNHVNFGDTEELEGSIPTGIGLLILGADKTIAENNTITRNGFSGIVVFSTLVLSVIADVPPEDILADIEPNPDGSRITGNILHNNGFNPPVIPDLPLPGVDLLWDGSGTGNCWSKNVFTSAYPSPLPSCN